jgi:hypothetical protein
MKPHHHGCQCQQQDGVPASKERCSNPQWPIRTKTQESARVLDVFNPNRVGQE